MKSWAIELAKSIKTVAKKSSHYYEGFVIGIVVDGPPSLKVSIDENIILNDYHLIVAASALNNYQRQIEFEQPNGTTTGTMTYLDALKVGDQVILIPSDTYQTFVLLDKVAEI